MSSMQSLQADFDKVVKGDVQTTPSAHTGLLQWDPTHCQHWIYFAVMRAKTTKRRKKTMGFTVCHPVSIQSPTVQVFNFGLPIVSYETVSSRVHSALVAQIALFCSHTWLNLVRDLFSWRAARSVAILYHIDILIPCGIRTSFRLGAREGPWTRYGKLTLARSG